MKYFLNMKDSQKISCNYFNVKKTRKRKQTAGEYWQNISFLIISECGAVVTTIRIIVSSG